MLFEANEEKQLGEATYCVAYANLQAFSCIIRTLMISMELFNHVRRHDTLADVFLYNLVDLAELILLEILNQQIFFMSNNFLPTHMNSCEQRSILLSWMNVEGFLEYKFS